MKNKSIIVGLILLLAILSLCSVYSVDESQNSTNKTSLTVSSEGPIDLASIIQDIKTNSIYKGHDNETLKWMESLGNMKVFSANDSFVVMNREDASKLPSEFVNDAYIDVFLECNVLENHSMGDVKYPKDVLLVKNVKYMGKEIHYLEV